MTNTSSPTPRFTTIERWCAISGLSRRVVYDRLGTGELKAIKAGTRTLIDVDAGLDWLRSLPPPTIRAPRQRQQTAA